MRKLARMLSWLAECLQILATRTVRSLAWLGRTIGSLIIPGTALPPPPPADPEQPSEAVAAHGETETLELAQAVRRYLRRAVQGEAPEVLRMALPREVRTWLGRLSRAELATLAEARMRDLAAALAGERAIPGVPTPQQAEARSAWQRRLERARLQESVAAVVPCAMSARALGAR